MGRANSEHEAGLQAAFRWPVPESGFRFVEWTNENEESAKPERALTHGIPIGGWKGTSGRMAIPLRDSPGLFIEFSKLNQDDEAQLLAFANVNGGLGGDVAVEDGVLPSADGNGVLMGEVEPLQLWRRQIRRMREAREVWDALQAQDDAWLKKHIVWSSDGDRVEWTSGEMVSVPSKKHPERKLPTGTRLIAHRSNGFHASLLDELKPPDLVAPAWIYLQRIINDELTPRVSARLLRDQVPHRLEVNLVPDSLIGALWLQMAWAVSGEARFRLCANEGCRRFIELSSRSNGKRDDARFCSDRCRVATHRRSRRVGGGTA